MEYFISDFHIGDANILTYEHRPFNSLHSMKETIITNIQKTVTPCDTLYILGDLGNTSILDEIPGKIIVVCGNHDNYEEIKNTHPDIYVSKYPIMIDNMWLSHAPIGYVPPECPYINIHGHLHRFQYGLIGRNWEEGNRYFNVSVENINYTPISKDEIIEKIKYKKV